MTLMLSFRARMKRKNDENAKRKNGEIALDSLYQPRRRARLFTLITAIALIGFVVPMVWMFSLPPRYDISAVLGKGQTEGGPVSAVRVNYRELTPSMGQYTLPDGLASFAIDRDASDMTISQRGELAYVRNNILYLHLDRNHNALPVNERPERPYFPVLALENPGEFSLLLPTWNLDGSRLYFVMRERGVGDRLYKFERTQLNGFYGGGAEPTLLYTGSMLMAPPSINPATGRILLVEHLQDGLTAFATIAAECTNPVACSNSRREVATIPASVSWADYHPSATLIAYSDYRTGDIHLLQPGTGETQPLIRDGRQKIRPAFSPDGQRLAYLADGRLYVVAISEDLGVSQVAVSDTDINIQAFAWWK